MHVQDLNLQRALIAYRRVRDSKAKESWKKEEPGSRSYYIIDRRSTETGDLVDYAEIPGFSGEIVKLRMIIEKNKFSPSDHPKYNHQV